MSEETAGLHALPQVKEWVDGWGSFDHGSFVLVNTTVAEAVVLADILWPRFVEYRGGVFLGFRFDAEGVDTWLAELDGDVPRVESMINHLHLWDIMNPAGDAEYVALSALAPRIAEAWRAALLLRLPDRDFVVTVADDPEDYGPTLYLASA
ncbi:hypothetical protein [Micromonospora cremea]|uniref:Uncharacterized protein n=1 Tax=Micromonospora cremea TaxID=709881 RepID=A0A1N6AIR1_9ACTN|nr:hypothetical protein [Micromonospora cremea]SIN33899.1 hypothetical protein SAMN04489832_5604 [Micromonospora cremea]